MVSLVLVSLPVQASAQLNEHEIIELCDSSRLSKCYQIELVIY